MSHSNVRNIESLETFHAGLIRLSSDWEQTLQEIRMLIQRADVYFSEDRPGYWQHQTQVAERELNEAKDNLAQKRAATRPGDRPPATEASKRVQKIEQRLRDCQLKQQQAKAWSIEISQQCDQLLGPLADVGEHCEVLLPAAANELRQLISALRKYAEQGKRAL
ncbi:MAG: hypothetical protein OSA98_01275 [Rubripirellula sp.]|nr:hypothetical protein [Rubripirellula sp.]